MPELRKDPIVGRWVIIAPDRAKRPIYTRGAWAPLRYVMTHRDSVSIRFFQPDSKLELVRPAFPVTAQEIGRRQYPGPI